MARCGCSGSSCGCKIVAGKNSSVRGSGTLNNPYAVDALPLSFTAEVSTTVDLTVTGDGSAGSPWHFVANAAPGLLDGVWEQWSGTKAEYDALGTYSDNVLYAVTG